MPSIPLIILIASSVTSCLYWLFYYFSPVIWSLSEPYPINEYFPPKRAMINEHSGIQVYVLCLIVFLSPVLSLILHGFFLNLRKTVIRNIFLILFMGMSSVLFISVGFYLPMAFPTRSLSGIIFVSIVLLVTMFLSTNYKAPWLPILIFAVLLELCLVTASPINELDWSFILSPAWRFLQGIPLNKSFCLYDYFMSMISALWMRIFPLDTIPLLGRLSFFALFFGCYLFARKFFDNKQLAVYLLLSIVITEMYGNLGQMDQAYQVTPLRLDWWLVLLALAYWKTIYHWTIGVTLGFLIIFHHSFGFIYSMSYFLLVLMLIILEGTSRKNSYVDLLSKFFSLCRKNFIYIFAGFLLYKFFLQPSVNPTSLFLKAGYGFIAISRHSFYWYMPILFASIFLLLWKNRPLLSPQYFETGIFILALDIGNSAYFFYRSHENNIVNIAAGFFVAFFLLLDLFSIEFKYSHSKFIRFVVPVAASMVVLVVSFQYAGRAVYLLSAQFSNFKAHRFFYSPCSNVAFFDFSTLRALSLNSPNVIFLSEKDFFFCYFGKYSLPQDYHCYMASWIFWKDYAHFLNNQLKKGYYIVVPRVEILEYLDIINSLNYRNYAANENYLIISNNPINKTLSVVK